METDNEFVGWEQEMEKIKTEFSNHGVVYEVDVDTGEPLDPKRKMILFRAHRASQVDNPRSLLISKKGVVEIFAITRSQNTTQQIIDAKEGLYESVLKPAEARLSSATPTNSLSESWPFAYLKKTEGPSLPIQFHVLDKEEWIKRKNQLLKPWRDLKVG